MRVLVVDDSPVDRRVAQLLLSSDSCAGSFHGQPPLWCLPQNHLPTSSQFLFPTIRFFFFRPRRSHRESSQAGSPLFFNSGRAPRVRACISRADLPLLFIGCHRFQFVRATSALFFLYIYTYYQARPVEYINSKQLV
jgi:hypothetical protein